MAETKTAKKPSKMGRRTITDEQVSEIQLLHRAGLSQAKIGERVGVSQRTVARYLSTFGTDQQELAIFKEHKGDILESVQAKGLRVIDMLLESFTEEEVSALKPKEKADVIKAITISNGTMFDKSRLHNGQSTSNVQSLLVTTQKKLDDMDVV